MEEFIFIGYRYFEVSNNNGTVNRGYTIYMLQPIKAENGNYGYMPVQVYNRYQNCMKFPTVSTDFFVQHNIKDIKINDKCLAVISREKLVDFKKK